MAEPMMWVPMRRRFVIDLIRYSDGSFTLESIGDLAETQLLSLFEGTFDEFGEQWFGARALEFAEEYFPHVAEEWREQEANAMSALRKKPGSLVWKEVEVPHGSGVRMHYGDEYHYAIVNNGQIEDADGRYSPSEWASKVAGGTSRNAWRDLWFKLRDRKWVPAKVLRDQARTKIYAHGNIVSEESGP